MLAYFFNKMSFFYINIVARSYSIVSHTVETTVRLDLTIGLDLYSTASHISQNFRIPLHKYRIVSGLLKSVNCRGVELSTKPSKFTISSRHEKSCTTFTRKRMFNGSELNDLKYLMLFIILFDSLWYLNFILAGCW